MSDDIVKKLREKPWRGGGESHDEVQIRRQKKREDGADLIEAQAKRIASLEAKITELKAEAKLWWDENIKKQTACEQMGKRITELETQLQEAKLKLERNRSISQYKDDGFGGYPMQYDYHANR